MLEQFIVPLLEALGGFLIGLFCLCNVWDAFFSSTFTCQNPAYCPGPAPSKRGLGGIPDWPSTITYLYQYFAPDWPSPDSYAGSWPPAHPCTTRMPTLATEVLRGPSILFLVPIAPSPSPFYELCVTGLPSMVDLYKALNMALSPTDANEAAYCLGMVLLWNESASPGYAFDPCDTLMASYWTGNMAWSALTAGEQAQALACINDRAHVGGLKRAAGGMLDFLPANTFATSSGGMVMATNVLGLAYDGFTAYHIQQQRSRDQTYPTYVLSSPNYQGSIAVNYGMALPYMYPSNAIHTVHAIKRANKVSMSRPGALAPWAWGVLLVCTART